MSTGETIFSILRPPDLCIYILAISHMFVSAHLRMHSSARLRMAQVRLRKQVNHICTHLTITFSQYNSLEHISEIPVPQVVEDLAEISKVFSLNEVQQRSV